MDFPTALCLIVYGIVIVGSLAGIAIWEYFDRKFFEELEKDHPDNYRPKAKHEHVYLDDTYEHSKKARQDSEKRKRERDRRDAQDAAAINANTSINIL